MSYGNGWWDCFSASGQDGLGRKCCQRCIIRYLYDKTQTNQSKIVPVSCGYTGCDQNIPWFSIASYTRREVRIASLTPATCIRSLSLSLSSYLYVARPQTLTLATPHVAASHRTAPLTIHCTAHVFVEGPTVDRNKAHACGTHAAEGGDKLGGGRADLAVRHGHDGDDWGASRGRILMYIRSNAASL